MILGTKLNQELNNLPTNLQILSIGECFDKNLDYLPESIIYFGIDYQMLKLCHNLPLSIVNIYTEMICDCDKSNYNINPYTNIFITENQNELLANKKIKL